MSHPRIEEVSDSDSDSPNLSDPSEDDIDDFLESDIIRARPSTTTTTQPTPPPPRNNNPIQPPPLFQQAPSKETYASHQTLYPLYFSSLHTRSAGRRVPSSLAIPNPLATNLVAACADLRLPTILEAGKTHPKDWSNPGRVKIDLSARPDIKNKHHLYILVGQKLKQFGSVTEKSDCLRIHMRGVPPPPESKTEWPKPAVPRGWKMNEFLPHYSAAMTGGGVSENFLKDMMGQMGAAGGAGGGAGGGMPDMASLLQSMGGMGGGGGPGGAGGMPDMASLLQSMGGMGGLGGMGGFPGMGGGGPSAGGSAGGKKEKKGKK
ncbi:hypothetical protein QBC38DRAFT_484113 [Podospora fimiseda]|uniref:Signal recognition particle SEC65 subunit n=1 Tax=Podospora fimiseda TaxID=252190 RepID=A0AAN7BKJ3_9PEZI|nr:hypothetical protein QBC38DRAFT_484113 [Podospora fimiseda]